MKIALCIALLVASVGCIQKWDRNDRRIHYQRLLVGNEAACRESAKVVHEYNVAYANAKSYAVRNRLYGGMSSVMSTLCYNVCGLNHARKKLGLASVTVESFMRQASKEKENE